jgi:Arc/MetJ-type ribon-helix-helix transcriptional regulator
MRDIITISLPKKINEDIEKEMKRSNFASKSEFFRYILRWWQEEEALKDLRQSEKEIAAGLAKELESVKELRQK